jgi:hypothetical protein
MDWQTHYRVRLVWAIAWRWVAFGAFVAALYWVMGP